MKKFFSNYSFIGFYTFAVVGFLIMMIGGYSQDSYLYVSSSYSGIKVGLYDFGGSLGASEPSNSLGALGIVSVVMLALTMVFYCLNYYLNSKKYFIDTTIALVALALVFGLLISSTCEYVAGTSILAATPG
jgi:hypothetical protein